MRKFLLFIIPLLTSIGIFSGLLIWLNNNSNKGYLQVTSNPVSKVYLNGKFVGNTTFCECDPKNPVLPVGGYVVKIVPDKDNLKPFEEKIKINKFALTVVDRTFSDIDNSEGSVVNLFALDDKKAVEAEIISIPEKANVFLDDSPIGFTPLLLKNLSEGNHNLRVTLKNHKDKFLKIKTIKGYKLASVVYLGLNPSLANLAATGSAQLSKGKVIILDTPTGFLRVREDDSVSSAQIGLVNPGEIYELLDERDDWFEIKIGTQEGKITKGWISSSYAQKQ